MLGFYWWFFETNTVIQSHCVYFVYFGFCIAFNTVQVISRQIVGRAEETSTYSWSRLCTVNCRPTASNYQLSHFTYIPIGPRNKPQPQRWEARVLPLCHHSPSHTVKPFIYVCLLRFHFGNIRVKSIYILYELYLYEYCIYMTIALF